MKLELDGKFITSFKYELPREPPDNIEYKPTFELEMGNVEEENNVIFAAFKFFLFSEEESITFNFKYVFFFRHDQEDIIKNHEKELAHNLYLICVPYIREFTDFIVAKSPLPPLNITNTGLPHE